MARDNILAWPYETVCACYLCEMSIVRIYSGKGVRVMSDDVAARDIRHFELSNKSITCHLFPTKQENEARRTTNHHEAVSESLTVPVVC